MRSASASADVGCIGLGNAESRRGGRVRDPSKPRLNLVQVRLLIEPSCLTGREPASLRKGMAAVLWCLPSGAQARSNSFDRAVFSPLPIFSMFTNETFLTPRSIPL